MNRKSNETYWRYRNLWPVHDRAVTDAESTNVAFTSQLVTVCSNGAGVKIKLNRR